MFLTTESLSIFLTAPKLIIPLYGGRKEGGKEEGVEGAGVVGGEGLIICKVLDINVFIFSFEKFIAR